MYAFILLLISHCSSVTFDGDELVQASAERVTIRGGQVKAVNILVRVKDGYHIQANKVRNEFTIPTTLVLRQSNEFKMKRAAFPSSKKFKLEGVDDYLEVYDGKFEIGVTLKATSEVQPGAYQLNGKLNYQACDSVRCFSPRDAHFIIEVDVQ